MSQRYPGGLIIKNPVAPTASAAPGIWTLDQAIQYIKSGNWPLPPPVDPYFNQTTLLLHGDGTNGAQNNTFLDSSTNNFTITRNGNTTQGTFSPFSVADGQWSNYFDGSGDYLSVADNAAFTLSTNNFSIEAFVYPTSSARMFIASQSDSSTSSYSFLIEKTASNELRIGITTSGGTEKTATSASTFAINQWSFIQMIRNGNTITGYVNGTSYATIDVTGDTIIDKSDPLTIGVIYNVVPFVGYISNFRLVNGTANSATVPTSPLTAISNTSLLTCQSNRFVDNSSNAFAITVNGNTSVQPFSPFAPSAAYSPTTNGGSGYFDGTGDYLSLADDAAWDFGSGDFTVEAWIYTTAGLGTSRTIVGQWQNSAVSTSAWQLYITTGNDVRFLYGVSSTQITTVISTSTVPLNTWTHLAVSKSGTDYALWFNGVREATRTATETLNNSAYELRVGNNNSNDYFDGFISNVRVVKGSAVYSPASTTITIPTTPLTAVSGTELLCNFTNAGIFDNTSKNNLETVADAQIDTTTKKFGTGSLEFDGTGDYLAIPASQDFAFGTGDFTFECWINTSVAPVTLNRRIIRIGANNVTGNFQVLLLTSEVLRVDTGATTLITGSVDVVDGAWHHIAVTRNGTDLKLFVDGTQDGSTSTNSTNFNQTVVQIGNDSTVAGTAYTGFIDDLRITKGVARYTTTFTPPTQAFPNQ